MNYQVTPIATDGSRARVTTWFPLIFLSFYLAALTGWLRPISDPVLIGRLEPILFLFFGYYFGRLPAKRAERNLRAEMERLSAKLEEAMRLKEQARGDLEAVEEKIRNARVALRSELIDLDAEKRSANGTAAPLGPRAIETAINILNS